MIKIAMAERPRSSPPKKIEAVAMKRGTARMGLVLPAN